MRLDERYANETAPEPKPTVLKRISNFFSRTSTEAPASTSAPVIPAKTAPPAATATKAGLSPPIGSILRNLQSGGTRVDEDGQVLHPSESQQRVASMLQNRFPRGPWG
jgi:hypothetical protein